MGCLKYSIGAKKITAGTRSGFNAPAYFWGLAVFALGIVGFILEGLFPGLVLPILGSNPYFYLLIDVFGLMAIVGMLVSAYRRYIAKVPRLGVGDWSEERTIVALIAGIVIMVISYYIGSAAHAVSAGVDRYVLAPITGILAGGMSLSASQVLYEVFWWLNVLMALGLLVFSATPIWCIHWRHL